MCLGYNKHYNPAAPVTPFPLMTMYIFDIRDALLIFLDGYSRAVSDAWIATTARWAASQVVGYDLNKAIGKFFTPLNLHQISVSEVLCVANHKGAGTAPFSI